MTPDPPAPGQEAPPASDAPPSSAPPAAPALKHDPAASAELIATGVDLLTGAIFGAAPADLEDQPIGGLTANEKAALRDAAQPLCAKYDLGFAGEWDPEITFGATTGFILMRRIQYHRRKKAEKEKAAKRSTEGAPADDTRGAGQEGVGEVGTPPKAGSVPLASNTAGADFVP